MSNVDSLRVEDKFAWIGEFLVNYERTRNSGQSYRNSQVNGIN